MAKTATDPKELLKKFEAEEAKALADFQAKLKEQRDKKLADLLKPLKEERGELASKRNEIDIRIAKLDKEISELTGIKPKEAGKRAKRKSKEEKLQIATIMYGAMTEGTKYPARELEKSADGVPVPQLVAIWNKANKDKKISMSGNRSTRRYAK